MKQSNDKGGIAMIPDKIYVKEFGEGISQMWSGIKATETAANVQHEYIRKEALLEWAEKELASYAEEIYSTDHYEDGCKDVLRQIIDKLNEM